MNTRTLPVVLVGLVLTLPALAADWPQWQGPDRNNVSKETGLLKSWPKEGPKLLWTYDNAGNGYSSYAIVGDRLYTLGARGETEYVISIDVNTGKEIWSREIAPYLANGSTKNYGIGTRGVPTIDGDLLYALGSQGKLVCLETAGGQQRWTVSLPNDLHGQMMSSWGWSESPLVDGDHVLVSPGGKDGTLACLDKKNGALLWRSKEVTDPAAYSSIVVAEAGGLRQYVQTTGQSVIGVAAKDGKLLWRQPKPEFRTAVIPTPIIHDDLVYTTDGYGIGCDQFKLTTSGDSTKAERTYDKSVQKNVENKHGGVVLVGDNIYGWTDSGGGRWVCQDFKTGKIVWESKDLGRGSITDADGHLYCYSESDGTAVLVEASPAGWKETGRFKIPKTVKPGSIWSHPVVANGRLYLRDQEMLYCYNVKE
jgi:outer membrane protein assembly factor BamB